MTESHKKKAVEVSCVECKVRACFPDATAAKMGRRELPPYCPAHVQKDVGEKALAKYTGKTLEFARNAALIENSCYVMNPDTGRVMMPMITLHPRAEEIIMISKIAGYKKLGIAFGVKVQKEAKLYTEILENNGFEVVSLCSGVGSIPKRKSSKNKDERPGAPGSEENIRNGLVMAELLNSENTDMNILMGLDVGQDTLFYKYAESFSIPFIVIDKVYGGATMEGVYQCFNSWGFRNYSDSVNYWGKLASPQLENLRTLRWPKGKE